MGRPPYVIECLAAVIGEMDLIACFAQLTIHDFLVDELYIFGQIDARGVGNQVARLIRTLSSTSKICVARSACGVDGPFPCLGR
jgi:predicted acetyltransferase